MKSPVFWLAAIALSVLLLGSVSCATSPQPIEPRVTVDRFLDFYFDEYGSGIPDTQQRDTLRPLLTADLNEALDRAAAAERCAKAQSQGQEPPLVQGDIFSSLFEKATAVTDIDQATANGQQQTYRLHFEWREPGAVAPATVWTDELILQAVDGRWLIDDFVHGGEWQFSVKGSMKAMLLRVAALCTAAPR